ncbi:antibiotic resistance protein [Agrobacterium rubi]|uniref:TfuA-like protein n=1 Tax=Agrobacterium rubi TaxID=28099 RepID=UPI001572F333|nr:TfuA-like protein [Agrobacterium rubi]NTF09636.1 antibiotic resistance protein [Agrobacterium rubi]NTF22543.1 antibiotic resistance protein [Agrobacterium rubi]NTF29400.1 antibiotic resistance protein [Agrobacterium rubi]
MKVVFVGPSLPNARHFTGSDIDIRPPACQGDVMRAVADGATAIGLIDGQFEMVAPVWHKELLFALSRNITVLGAASMGALRAAECADFGMIGIGTIFEDYVSGRRVDDADVALTYGPAELGYPPSTIPLVNAQATIARISELGMLSAASCQALDDAAQALFFKRRSWKSIATLSGVDVETLKPILAHCRVDQKKLDAMKLLEIMEQTTPPTEAADWQFNATPLFRKLYL